MGARGTSLHTSQTGSTRPHLQARCPRAWHRSLLRAGRGQCHPRQATSAPFLGSFQAKGRLRVERSPTSSSVPPQPPACQRCPGGLGFHHDKQRGVLRPKGLHFTEAALGPSPLSPGLPLTHASCTGSKEPSPATPCRKGTCTGTPRQTPGCQTQPLLASETAPSSGPTSLGKLLSQDLAAQGPRKGTSIPTTGSLRAETQAKQAPWTQVCWRGVNEQEAHLF